MTEVSGERSFAGYAVLDPEADVRRLLAVSRQRTFVHADLAALSGPSYALADLCDMIA